VESRKVGRVFPENYHVVKVYRSDKAHHYCSAHIRARGGLRHPPAGRHCTKSTKVPFLASSLISGLQFSVISIYGFKFLRKSKLNAVFLRGTQTNSVDFHSVSQELPWALTWFMFGCYRTGSLHVTLPDTPLGQV